MLVFLIDNDQAQWIDWRENGRACADDDAGAALANLVPFIVAFAGGKMAVQNSDQRLQRAGTESGFETLDRLRRERNLRHEDDGAFPLRKCVGNGLQIDFGFAAARDAVQKKGRRMN